jgi:hypothetical protein
MFISPSFDVFSTVGQIILFIAAFVGPEQNPKEMVALERKLDALNHLAETGDSRQCDDVIGSIRKKKKEAEDTLKIYVKSRKELQDGIASNLKWLQNNAGADPNIRKTKQQDIDAYAAMLEIGRFHETRLDTLIAGRDREEQAFALLCDAIKAKRHPSKAP